MKIITLITVLFFSSCSHSVFHSRYSDLDKEYNDYLPIAQRQKDSMQIINKFIDGLPDTIKSLPEIRSAYIRNLDNTKAISDKLLDLYFKMIELSKSNN